MQIDSTAANPQFPIILSSHPTFVSHPNAPILPPTSASAPGTPKDSKQQLTPALTPDTYFLDVVIEKVPEEVTVATSQGAAAAWQGAGGGGARALSPHAQPSAASYLRGEDEWEMLAVTRVFPYAHLRLSPVRLQLEENWVRHAVQTCVELAGVFGVGPAAAAMSGRESGGGVGGGGVLLSARELAFVLAVELPVDTRVQRLYPYPASIPSTPASSSSSSSSPAAASASINTTSKTASDPSHSALARVLSAASLQALLAHSSSPTSSAPSAALPSSLTAAAAHAPSDTTIYFLQSMEIGALKLKFTFVTASRGERAKAAARDAAERKHTTSGSSGGGWWDSTTASASTVATADYWAVFLASSGLHAFLTNLTDATISLPAHHVRHHLGPLSGLLSSLRTVYAKHLQAQALGLIGSAEFLGNPMALVKSLSEGITDFVGQPVAALSDGSDVRFCYPLLLLLGVCQVSSTDCMLCVACGGVRCSFISWATSPQAWAKAPPLCSSTQCTALVTPHRTSPQASATLWRCFRWISHTSPTANRAWHVTRRRMRWRAWCWASNSWAPVW